ncbi:MAG: GNAT family N-acetyltransferase, partial [Bacilli bacterium]|nr:GNAT family N-acetyltransferase [Bacilli bacterium]
KRKVDYLTHKAQILDGFDYWAVLYNKKVVGYCYSYQNKDSILIDNLLIAQDYRKQHIASSLINHINKISGEKVVMLHADKDNYPYSIYKKLGFEVIDNIYEYLWVGLQK